MSDAVIRILVVDDEPPLLKMMKAYLGRLGYEVATAGSTELAWACVQAAPHDFRLVVLDATMKGISMEELASGMLAIDPRLCVIAVSGYPVDIGALRTKSPERVEFLHKPFTPEMLGNAVRRMLATQKTDI